MCRRGKFLQRLRCKPLYDLQVVRPEFLPVSMKKLNRHRVFLYGENLSLSGTESSFYRNRTASGPDIVDYGAVCQAKLADRNLPYLLLCHGNLVPLKRLVRDSLCDKTVRLRIVHQQDAERAPGIIHKVFRSAVQNLLLRVA